jgi:hypothetical protein
MASNNGYSPASGLKSSLNGGFLPTQLFFEVKVRIYITTNGQSAILSWNKAPIWGLRADLY